MITVTVPLVAAHLLVTPQPCDCAPGVLPGHDPAVRHPMVLRFLPTDADTECETCGGLGHFVGWDYSTPAEDRTEETKEDVDCLDCDAYGRRPLRAGDRIAIRADDTLPEHGTRFGEWKYSDASSWPWLFNGRTADNGRPEGFPLRPGEVVGHATVARVLPVVDGRGACGRSFDDSQPHICWWGNSSHTCAYDGEDDIDISDHLDAGLVFAPGQVALELTDVESGK